MVYAYVPNVILIALFCHNQAAETPCFATLLTSAFSDVTRIVSFSALKNSEKFRKSFIPFSINNYQ